MARACELGNTELMKILLDEKADVNASELTDSDKAGCTIVFRGWRVHFSYSDCTQAPHGKDKEGGLWCAIAKTEWGTIPGWARPGESTCYFEYYGPQSSTNFTLVQGVIITDDASEIEPLGMENGEAVYCGVATSPSGCIPGKARVGGWCQYAHHGVAGGGPTGFRFIGPRKPRVELLLKKKPRCPRPPFSTQCCA